jgi:hypothetical protein
MIPRGKLTRDKFSVQHLSWTEAIHLARMAAAKPQHGMCVRIAPWHKKLYAAEIKIRTTLWTEQHH